MGSYHGILFGMCICYDIFFPEILHGCSLGGASVNICCAASAVPSKPFFDAVLPARAVENTTYLAYVNSVGQAAGLEMHGCSRGLDPFGNAAAECGTDECVSVMRIDTDHLAECRKARRHLSDFRSDIDWLKKDRNRTQEQENSFWPRAIWHAKSINATTSSSPTKPRWSSPVRREPGKLVGVYPSGVQISPSALLMSHQRWPVTVITALVSVLILMSCICLRWRRRISGRECGIRPRVPNHRL